MFNIKKEKKNLMKMKKNYDFKRERANGSTQKPLKNFVSGKAVGGA